MYKEHYKAIHKTNIKEMTNDKRQIIGIKSIIRQYTRQR